MCVGVDKSGESPGLTGHTPRQVANNVSRKKNEGSGHTFALLCFYSPFYGTTAIIRIPFLFLVLNPVFFTITLFTLSVFLPFSSPSFPFTLGDDTVRRPWLIGAHPRGRKDAATSFTWLLFTLLAKSEGSRPLDGLMESNKTSCAPPGMGSVNFPHIPW